MLLVAVWSHFDAFSRRKKTMRPATAALDANGLLIHGLSVHGELRAMWQTITFAIWHARKTSAGLKVVSEFVT
ncbi:MAG: hypothetical protein ACKVP5_14950 [Aestuariivirga sp.]